MLVACGRTAPRSHDLEQLAAAVEHVDPSFAGWAERLLPLGEFGVAQRYPIAYEPEADLQSLFGQVAQLIERATAACHPRG